MTQLAFNRARSLALPFGASRKRPLATAFDGQFICERHSMVHSNSTHLSKERRRLIFPSIIRERSCI